MQDRLDSICIALLFILGIAAFGHVAWEFYDRLTDPGSAAVASRPRTHQVLPGDTLWGIATKYYPNHHTGEMVYEIRKLNGLDESATLYPYTMVLKLPDVD